MPGVPPAAQVPAAPPEQFRTPGPYYQSPGEIPPPPGPYFSPAEVPPAGQYPPYAPGPQAPASSRQGLPKSLIAVLVIGVLIIAGSAAAYFLLVKGNKTYSAPEQAVVNYFETLASGDMYAVATLFVPEARPSPETLAALGKLYVPGTYKFSEFQLKTLSETATDATIQINDFKVTVSMGGQSATESMSKIFARGALAVRLKYANGSWLICSPASVQLPAGTSI
jgi:hypothetical protein